MTARPSIYSTYSSIFSLSPGINVSRFFSHRLQAAFNRCLCKILCLWKLLLRCFCGEGGFIAIYDFICFSLSYRAVLTHSTRLCLMIMKSVSPGDRGLDAFWTPSRSCGTTLSDSVVILLTFVCLQLCNRRLNASYCHTKGEQLE